MKKSLFILLMSYSFSIIACPDQLLLIRHGEKIEGTKHLSIAGKKRANALPHFFMTPNSHFERPTFIVALVDKSNRPRKTCRPTAEALGLTMNFTYSIPDAKNGKMAKYLLQQHGVGLVCLEHNVVEPLVMDLTKHKINLDRWPDNIFDRVLILHFKKVDGVCQFRSYEDIHETI